MTTKDIAVIAFVLAVLVSGYQPQIDSVSVWMQACFMFSGGVWMLCELACMAKRFIKYFMTDHGEYEG